MSQAITNFVVPISGAKIVGEQAGAGEPIIFLHAGVGDKRMWRDQLANLSDRYHCIAYDCRGSGETTTTDEPFSHVEDLRLLLDHFALEAVTLVGCSKGGRNAIDFALAYPERVRAMVLIAPAISGAPPIAMSDELEAIYVQLDEADDVGDIDRVNEIEARIWLDGPTSPEGRVADQQLRQLFLDMNGIELRAPELTQEIEAPPAYYRLGNLLMPKLILCGELDFPQYLARHEHLGKWLPNTRFERIADTAHLPSMEKPALINQLLQSFFDEINTNEFTTD